MTKENITKSYCICKKCEDNIPLNTYKELVYCSCKAIYVDGCEDYVRIGGDKDDFELSTNN